MSLPNPPLLLVTDRRQAALPLAEVVASALVAGCRWVSIREKDLPPPQQIALARALLPLVRRFGAQLVLHGDPAVARAGGLDGVHLAAGRDPAAARAQLGPAGLVGLSIHSVREAAAVDRAAVDYLIAGPVHATASKPGYGPPLGIDGLAAIVRASGAPVIAIGGVTPAHVKDVMAAGAAGIAVMGSVMRAREPGQEVKALLAALAARHQPRPR
jgi:thiamine-phosphate pyrophosphorylase